MRNERIVFMGTPVFGREICRTLVESGYNVVGAVTQPDKAVGRKQIITFSPVKQYCLDQGIEVFQPVRIRNDYQKVIDMKPDLIVTCAYGQIIPDELLNCPRLGCVNVHASLLPKLRGGAPIQHAIMDGYKMTGVTIMEMASRMDAGDMISSAATEIRDDDTYRSLHDRLITIGQKLLLETIESILDHSYTAQPQDEKEVTFGFNITKQQEHVDLTGSYDQVYDQIRSLIDEPCSYVIANGKKIKITAVSKSDIIQSGENGTLVFIGKGLGMIIDGRIIMIERVQMEGKNEMSAKEFRNGAGRNLDGVVCS